MKKTITRLLNMRDSKNQYSIITKEVIDEVYPVYSSNENYFILSDGKKATLRNILNDMNEVPPKFDSDNKLFLQIRRKGETIGILDIIVGYPIHDSLWIGLLIIHNEFQHTGIGQEIINHLIAITRECEYKQIQLGVIASNTPALLFWRKMGFKEISRKHIDRNHGPHWDIIVMKRDII